MTLHEQLAAVVRRENRDGELPDYIVPELLKIAEDPERCANRPELLRTLIEQVKSYETFSEVSCGKNGCGLEDIRKTLQLIEAN